MTSGGSDQTRLSEVTIIPSQWYITTKLDVFLCQQNGARKEKHLPVFGGCRKKYLRGGGGGGGGIYYSGYHSELVLKFACSL